MDLNLLVALTVVLFWGLWAFFWKIGVDQIGQDRAIFWAFLTFFFLDAAIFAAMIFYQKVPLAFSNGAGYIILGSAASVIGTVFLISYLRKTALSTAIPMTALYPAVTTILALLVLKEKIKLTSAVGILLALAAAVLLAL